MSRTRNIPLTPKEEFLSKFEHKPIMDFSFWPSFARKAKDLYSQESQLLSKKIKEFDNKISNEMNFDENGQPLTTDGFDHFEDDVFRLDEQQDEILVLMFIGTFKDFEKKFKVFALELLYLLEKQLDQTNTKAGRTLLTKPNVPIGRIKDAIARAGIVDILSNSELSSKWSEIYRHSELRNIFAHNENPVIDDIYPNRLPAIREIAFIKIVNNYVLLEDVKIIEKSCTLYQEFLEILVQTIAEKVYQ